MNYLKVMVAIVAMVCAGCGDNTEEVKALRKEMAQLKSEVRGLRQQLERKHASYFERAGRPMSAQDAPLSRPGNFRQRLDGTNGVRSVRDFGGRIAPTKEDVEARRKMREEFEARRKAMKDPEQRRKFEEEHRKRMEERRRMHEERRREIKARREADKPKSQEVPSAQAQ